MNTVTDLAPGDGPRGPPTHANEIIRSRDSSLTMTSSVALPMLLTVAVLAGCTGIKNQVSPPGRLGDDGRITPCHGHRRDLQACGNALFNAPRVPLLQLGQTKEQVRQLMEHDAESLSARTVNGQTIETWGYVVNYQKYRVTEVTFTNGLVTAIDTKSR